MIKLWLNYCREKVLTLSWLLSVCVCVCALWKLLLATLFIVPTLAWLLFLELHVGKYAGSWQTAT